VTGAGVDANVGSSGGGISAAGAGAINDVTDGDDGYSLSLSSKVGGIIAL